MNMLRPSMASMLKPGDNYYAFVVAVAKHARELAQEAEDSHEIMEEKPVKKSVEEGVMSRRFSASMAEKVSCTWA